VAGAGTLSLDAAIGLGALGRGWPGLLIAGVAGLSAGAGQLALFFRPPARAGRSAAEPAVTAASGNAT